MTQNWFAAPQRPAGRIGVLFGGLGAISTTLVAGVEAIKKGLAQPIGSLALLGTIDAGTEENPGSSLSATTVDLAGLDDLVFGAWDIVATDGYVAARRAAVLEPALLDKLAPELASVRPWPGIFDQRFNRRVNGAFHKTGRDFIDLAEPGQGRHPEIPG